LGNWFDGYGYQGEGTSPAERLRLLEDAAQYPAPPPAPAAYSSPPAAIIAPRPPATPHGTFDFETASEAGHVWVEPTQVWDPRKSAWKEQLGKWDAPVGARRKGINAVNAAAYAGHPSTRVLTLSYRLPADWRDVHGVCRGEAEPIPDGLGGIKFRGVVKRWRPGNPLPQDLFDYLAAGGVMEAHNAMFERMIWELVCVPKYGFPSLMPWFYQLRCSMAKARVNAYPGGLGELGRVLGLSLVKDKDGKRLLDKFSVPRNPTQKDPRTWILPEDEPDEAERLYGYCDQDVLAEEAASAAMPDMSPDELLFWWVDQEINWRGIGVDRPGIKDCLAILGQALEQYGDEFREITGGLNPTQLEATRGWLAARGLHMYSMDEEAITDALERLPPPPPGRMDPRRRVLEIRQLIGSASVKKLHAMDLQASADDRLRNLIVHHGARTGRPTGEGPQPLNLPKAGPELVWCGQSADGKSWAETGCRKPFRPGLDACPWCNASSAGLTPREWTAAACDPVLEIMASRSLALVEWFFGSALLCISGCLRGLFIAAPGHDLIASDYTAIEAVVIAMLAKCEWRIEAFRNKEPIYLLSASKITGTPVETYLKYAAETGQHHPDRGKKGKIAELAGGFGGWIGAWRNFGFDGTDEEAKQQILAWRAASPEIPELWGGQRRRGSYREPDRQEFFGFEGAAVQALMYPGVVFECAGIKFRKREDGALIVTLLSGRPLTYHDAQLVEPTQPWAAPWEKSISFWTWNTNPKYGPMGWVPSNTYGGKLTENIVQAVAHDLLRFAILNLRAAGYPTVLHVYDEIVLEGPHGLGSVEEVERIMGIMPPWAEGWPVRASGGWRGRRYRKD